MCGVHCSAHLSFCREVPEEEVEEKEKEVVVPGTGRVYGPNDGGSTWGVTACTCATVFSRTDRECKACYPPKGFDASLLKLPTKRERHLVSRYVSCDCFCVSQLLLCRYEDDELVQVKPERKPREVDSSSQVTEVKPKVAKFSPPLMRLEACTRHKGDEGV